MVALPIEVLRGISFGVLIGIVLALVIGLVGFTLNYYAGRSLPGSAVVAAVLVGAAIDGYLVGVLDTSLTQVPRVIVATLVVVMLGLYANSLGQRIATALPRDTDRTTRRQRTLSGEAADAVDGTGQVTIRSTGEVGDVDGYPSLAPGTRRAIADGAWRLPADLPLDELETRLERRLATEYDLAAVSVSLDGQGLATVSAAPSAQGVASRVPEGSRAVSVQALLPTGLTRGETVTVTTAAGTATGTVLGLEAGVPDGGDGRIDPDGEDPRLDGTVGGLGRVTVAVPTVDAGALLDAADGRVIVEPGDTNPAFEAVSLLDRADVRVRKVALDEETRAVVAEADRAWLLAARAADADDTDREGWRFRPDEEYLATADEAFVVGDRDLLERVADRPDPAAREVAA